MEIITSHNNTDFDGFAAMMAAKKIYPDAQLVFSGKLHRNVREFMSLHKDTLSVSLAKDIPLDQVDRLILVDTKTPSRIGELKSLIGHKNLDIHIYDHHPRFKDDILGNLEIITHVGAATTLLVEIIKERAMPINPFEATIYALGIYEDTGCLTFSTTTPRDAEAIAFLLTCGAKLSVIADFIGRPLTETQKSLLNTLLASAENLNVNGVSVLLAKTSINEYVSGLSLLTHKLGDVVNADVIFSVVQMEDRVHIVARNKLDSINLKEIVQEFGGGGHASAASASIKDANLDEIISSLYILLKEKIRPLTIASQIMSAPVKYINQSITIDEAGKILLRYGHTGLPAVNEKGQLVGIISRRDIDKAKHHGLGHAPVKGYMSHKVVSITPETTIQEIQHLMIENNIGRLPVIENSLILGIVSRTDVLKTLHGEHYPQKYTPVYSTSCPIPIKPRAEIDKLMQLHLPDEIRDLLSKVGYLADKTGYNVYVVGGFVRDLLLAVDNLDIDIVVEGDGIEFAKELAKYLCGRVRTHDKFGTAMVIVNDKIKLDIATARTEYYEFPAALPKVETSSLRQDLYRRDFTINAMALNLNSNNFGGLIDYFCGRKDLEDGIIRILYNLSFVEDPTRILRAIRFEQRYNFAIEEQTLELAKNVIKEKMLLKLSGDRIREELKNILGEANPWKSINRMNQLEIWPYIIPGVEINDMVGETIAKMPHAIAVIAEEFNTDEFSHWLLNLITLIHNADSDTVDKILFNLRLTKEDETIVKAVLSNWQSILGLLEGKRNLKPSVVYNILRPMPIETYAFLLAKAEKPLVEKRIKQYFDNKKNHKLNINGEDIKEMGFKPGPIFNKVLDALREAKLDGLVKNRQEELDLVKKLLKSKEID